MYKNRPLIDKTLIAPSVNDNMVITYNKLISLIEEYNRMASDKGLPTKKIPVYSNNMNGALISRLLVNILRDIDRIKNIKEDEDREEDNGEDTEEPKEQKTKINVRFTTNTFNMPAWKEDGSLWYYMQDGDDICVYADANAVLERMDGGTTLELDYDDMPYEVLIDTEEKEWKVNKYVLDIGQPSGLFGYRANRDVVWNDDVIGKLTSLTLRNWTNRNVTDMSFMFMGNFSNTLDLSSFNTNSVTYMRMMFYLCSGLTTLTLGENFILPTDYKPSKVFLAPIAECTITMNENAYNAFKQYDLASYTFSPASWDASGGAVQEIIVTPPPMSS